MQNVRYWRGIRLFLGELVGGERKETLELPGGSHLLGAAVDGFKGTLDRFHFLFAEKDFTALGTDPRGDLVEKKVVSLAIGVERSGAASHGPSALQAFHAGLLFR